MATKPKFNKNKASASKKKPSAVLHPIKHLKQQTKEYQKIGAAQYEELARQQEERKDKNVEREASQQFKAQPVKYKVGLVAVLLIIAFFIVLSFL